MFIMRIGEHYKTKETMYIVKDDNNNFFLVNNLAEMYEEEKEIQPVTLERVVDFLKEETTFYKELNTDKWYKVYGVCTERITGIQYIHYRKCFGLLEDVFCPIEEFINKKNREGQFIYETYESIKDTYNEELKHLKLRKNILF